MRRGVEFRPSQKQYDSYYLLQAGDGLARYVAGNHQSGRGLGSIFGGVARTLFPILKSGAKTLLREGVKTGAQVASDVISGQNIKTAVRRAGESGKRLLNKAVSGFTGVTPPPPPPGRVRKRIKRRRAGVASQKTSKKRRITSIRDIFG